MLNNQRPCIIIIFYVVERRSLDSSVERAQDWRSLGHVYDSRLREQYTFPLRPCIIVRRINQHFKGRLLLCRSFMILDLCLIKNGLCSDATQITEHLQSRSWLRYHSQAFGKRGVSRPCCAYHIIKLYFGTPSHDVSEGPDGVLYILVCIHLELLWYNQVRLLAGHSVVKVLLCSIVDFCVYSHWHLLYVFLISFVKNGDVFFSLLILSLLTLVDLIWLLLWCLLLRWWWFASLIGCDKFNLIFESEG